MEHFPFTLYNDEVQKLPRIDGIVIRKCGIRKAPSFPPKERIKKSAHPEMNASHFERQVLVLSLIFEPLISGFILEV